MRASRTDYLLAMLVGVHTKETPEEVIQRVDSALRPGRTEEQIALDQALDEAVEKEVEAIYAAYPTKCPESGRLTGKCAKNKVQIRTLLKTRTKDDVLARIEEYLNDCKEHKSFIKNFSTFLNNVPEDVREYNKVRKQTPYYR